MHTVDGHVQCTFIPHIGRSSGEEQDMVERDREREIESKVSSARLIHISGLLQWLGLGLGGTTIHIHIYVHVHTCTCTLYIVHVHVQYMHAFSMSVTPYS